MLQPKPRTGPAAPANLAASERGTLVYKPPQGPCSSSAAAAPAAALPRTSVSPRASAAAAPAQQSWSASAGRGPANDTFGDQSISGEYVQQLKMLNRIYMRAVGKPIKRVPLTRDGNNSNNKRSGNASNDGKSQQQIAQQHPSKGVASPLHPDAAATSTSMDSSQLEQQEQQHLQAATGLTTAVLTLGPGLELQHSELPAKSDAKSPKTTSASSQPGASAESPQLVRLTSSGGGALWPSPASKRASKRSSLKSKAKASFDASSGPALAPFNAGGRMLQGQEEEGEVYGEYGAYAGLGSSAASAVDVNGADAAADVRMQHTGQGQGRAPARRGTRVIPASFTSVEYVKVVEGPDAQQLMHAAQQQTDVDLDAWMDSTDDDEDDSEAAAARTGVRAGNASGPRRSAGGSEAARGSQSGTPTARRGGSKRVTAHPAAGIKLRNGKPKSEANPAKANEATDATDDGADGTQPEQQQTKAAKLPGKPTIRMVIEATLNAHKSEQSMTNFKKLVKRGAPLVLNTAMLNIAKIAHAHEASMLLAEMQRVGKANEHSFAMIFSGLGFCGRLDVALGVFEGAVRSGVDMGPVGCSALVKMCSDADDEALALKMFMRMQAAKMTMNRYTYNALICLCSRKGLMKDALQTYTLMAAAANDSHSPLAGECRPDMYTYSALVRCANSCQQWDLLPRLFREMAAAGPGAVTQDVWSQFIWAAARAGRADWAEAFFDAGVRDLRLAPSIVVYNALLAAVARKHSIEQMRELYVQMQVAPFGLRPDAYTFTALLTNLAQWGASLSQVDEVVAQMERHAVPINAFIGTSLFNAYRRTPELLAGSPELRRKLLAAAERLAGHLKRNRMYNASCAVCLAALYADALVPHKVTSVLREAEMAGVVLDALAYRHVAKVAEGAGLADLAEELRAHWGAAP